MIVSRDNPMWNEYLGKLPLENQDIYFASQYYLLEEQAGHGQAQMFAYMNHTDNLGLYTFLKRPVSTTGLTESYYDIETAYGYGGPLVRKRDPRFIEEFENAFLQYCQSEKIIAEFIRFHPLIKNETIFKKNIQILHNRKTVWIDLTQNIDSIWMNHISTQNRNTIRKCIKNNLVVTISENYDEFMDIYNETMRKVGADSFYLFDEDYYNLMKGKPNYILFNVNESGSIIAAAIFMGYGDYFHYHLSGSRKEALNQSPNNLLLWEAINYAKNHNYKKMHLGGGLTDSTEDNLFRFKSKFSKEYADFYIGKRVHNPDVYNRLIRQWETEHGEKAGLFLQYRY